MCWRMLEILIGLDNGGRPSIAGRLAPRMPLAPLYRTLGDGAELQLVLVVSVGGVEAAEDSHVVAGLCCDVVVQSGAHERVLDEDALEEDDGDAEDVSTEVDGSAAKE